MKADALCAICFLAGVVATAAGFLSGYDLGHERGRAETRIVGASCSMPDGSSFACWLHAGDINGPKLLVRVKAPKTGGSGCAPVVGGPTNGFDIVAGICPPVNGKPAPTPTPTYSLEYR